MKPVLTISLIVLSCLGIGIYQYSRLAALKAETLTLKQPAADRTGQTRTQSGSSTAAPMQTGSVQAGKSLAEIETMMARSFGLIAKWRGGGHVSPAEQAEAQEAHKLLLSTFAGLDHRSVFDLIEHLKTSASLPSELRENIAAACLEILMAANPKEALGLLQMSGESPGRENQTNQAFHQWANANPGEALRWFEEESKKGSPVAATPGLREAAMLAKARVDPAGALSHVQFERLLTNPENSTNPGASIAASLGDARENAAFLGALRREQEKSPGSANLAKIREGFIGELSGRMHRWSFEEASRLIDSEFTAAEKVEAVERIAMWGDLAESVSWATWFSKLDVPAGDRHPLRGFIVGWAHNDPVSAGKWLNQLPPGELRNSFIVEYTFQLADIDPVTATKEAMALPAGERRNKILRQIAKKWKAKDPSAAAAFAKENNLPE